MKNFKKILSLLLITLFSISLVACSSNDSTKKDKPLEYIEDSQLTAMYSNPKDFKNKGVKLYGKVFTVEKDDKSTYLQMWADVNGSEMNTIIADTTTDNDYKEGDIIYIDGIVYDEFKGKNAFGAEVTAPSIYVNNAKITTYMEAYKPAIETVDANQVYEQNGVIITLQKAEIAKDEFRVYLKVENNSPNTFNYYPHNMKIIQDSKQFESEYVFEEGYPEIQNELLSGATTEGIVVFKPLNPEIKEFQFYSEGSSNDYTINFEPFVFNVSW